MDKCDICGTKIEDGKCPCGIWLSKKEFEENPFKKALDHFHEMKQAIVTGDAPHLGSAFVFFRGDYKDCKKVQEFIYQMKNRPFYEGK